MPTMMERGEAFLARGSFALVGVSSDPRAFSRLVLKELLARGYDVTPVCPSARLAEHRACVAHMQDVLPRPLGALVMTPPERSAEVVRDCLAAGVREIWFHQGGGQGSASAEALSLCREAGVEPITGLCPFMVLEGASWFHRAHRFFRAVSLGRRERAQHA